MKRTQASCLWTAGLLAMAAGFFTGGSAAQNPVAAPPLNDRLARLHLTMRYEKTADLLNHLQRNDPSLQRQLLDVGRQLAVQNERTAMGLAQKHHPELADLLAGLKNENPKAFASAMQSLYSDATRLKRILSKNPDQHPHALKAWEARSRIRLLAARMKRREKPEDEKELLRLLSLEEEAKRRVSELQRERLGQLMQRVDKRLDKDASQTIEQQLKQLRRAMEKTGKAKASKNKAD